MPHMLIKYAHVLICISAGEGSRQFSAFHCDSMFIAACVMNLMMCAICTDNMCTMLSVDVRVRARARVCVCTIFFQRNYSLSPFMHLPIQLYCSSYKATRRWSCEISVTVSTDNNSALLLQLYGCNNYYGLS